MSERPTAGDGTEDNQPLSASVPLRRVLSAAGPSLLAAVVERFWQDRGHHTERAVRSGHRFLLVRDTAGHPVHLVWLDPAANATPKHVVRLARMADRFGGAEATLTSGRDYEDAVYAAADEYGVECLAAEQLVTFVTRAGLDEVVHSHATTASTSAVADGGATARAPVELTPPADHPVALRAGLVGGGAALTLLAVWGGAAEVTARLQSCSGECTLLWALSFVPLLLMLVGSFAVAVGVFD